MESLKKINHTQDSFHSNVQRYYQHITIQKCTQSFFSCKNKSLNNKSKLKVFAKIVIQKQGVSTFA